MSTIGGVVGNTQITVMERYGRGTKIGNFVLPDFTKSTGMYTKTEPSMSDEELKEAIAKIAREDAEKGLLQNQTKAFLDLRKEYISSVSPNRESIITNSMKQINSIIQTLEKTNSPKQAKTLMQFIMDMEKGNYQIINGYGNGYGKLCTEGDKLTYVEFYGSNGEMIASCDSKTGWSCAPTKEEAARQREFISTYNEAWRGATASVPKHLDGGATIDAYA